MSAGQFILHRFNGDEIYHCDNAVMRTHPADGIVLLWLTVDTQIGAVQTLPDTADLGAHPSASVCVKLSDFDPATLVGQRFVVPNTDDDDDYRTLNYCEHQELDNNEVEFIDRRQNEFLVRWTGETCDVNYYDGSKPRTRIEVECWFRLDDGR